MLLGSDIMQAICKGLMKCNYSSGVRGAEGGSGEGDRERAK